MPATVCPWDSATIIQEIKHLYGGYYPTETHFPLSSTLAVLEHSHYGLENVCLVVVVGFRYKYENTILKMSLTYNRNPSLSFLFIPSVFVHCVWRLRKSEVEVYLLNTQTAMKPHIINTAATSQIFLMFTSLSMVIHLNASLSNKGFKYASTQTHLMVFWSEVKVSFMLEPVL